MTDLPVTPKPDAMLVPLEPLATPGEPWEAYLVPTPFPMTEPSLSLFRIFVLDLAQRLLQLNLKKHVFVHSWKLRTGANGRLVQEHLEDWQPRLGMGIWPDRDPPQPLNQESFMDLSADGILNKELPLPASRLLHLGGTQEAVTNAVGQVFGSAALSLFFSRKEFAEIRAEGKELYLPTIKASVYTHENFYMPLLDRHSLVAASSSQELEAWLCGVDVYVRESAEDGGILLIARLPLSVLLEQVAEAAGISFVRPGIS